MIDLPARFKIRMEKLLGDSVGEFLAVYDKKPYRAIRINTLKTDKSGCEKLLPFPLGESVPWEKDGFYVDTDGVGKTIAHAAGLYYVQEPSAMCAAPLLDVKGGERVLDMCSAPGGKGTQLAQNMKGEGIIVLNEVNFSRAKLLSGNVERLGIRNAAVTCAQPEAIAKAFEGYFDKIIVDAPCSGEGMFRKEENAVREWSESAVISCAARQKNILDCADRALREGGRLVYSTCTFSPEEDEEQIENFLKAHKNYSLLHCVKLYPHKIKGEGHFAALLQKGEDGEISTRVGEIPLFKPVFNDKKLLALYLDFEQKYLKTHYPRLHLSGDTLISVPEDCPRIDVQTLRLGVRLGTFKGGRFEPDHSLAMASAGGDADFLQVDAKTALSYLGGNTFACDESLSGWKIVSYSGYPLGWCKAVGGVAKNHLPKGVRI